MREIAACQDGAIVVCQFAKQKRISGIKGKQVRTIEAESTLLAKVRRISLCGAAGPGSIAIAHRVFVVCCGCVAISQAGRWPAFSLSVLPYAVGIGQSESGSDCYKGNDGHEC
jgi:hypothetical protein